MAGVFISYRRGDASGYAGRLREALERRLGTGQVFRDADTIRPGQDFVQAIDAELADCEALLVLIGEEWLRATNAAGQRRLGLDDDWVTLEVAGGLKRPEVLVIPVLVEGTRMPPADDLPPSIRDLARRQAISVRDESWDEDVDRLASVLRPARHEPTVARPRRSTRMVSFAAVIVALAIAVAVLARFRAADVHTAGSSSDAAGTGFPIEVPRIAEFADGSVIHTVLSARVTPRGPANVLVFQVRFANEGSYDANFWNSSYRLLADEQTLAPVGDLNEVVASHAAKDGTVSFEVPVRARNVRLRVESREDPPGTLPLDLTKQDRRTGAASRAVIDRIAEGDQLLVSNPSGSLTLIQVTSRRFVNTLRVTFAIRMNNAQNYARHFGTIAARVILDGVSNGPVDGPNETVAGGSSSPARDFVFDVPPETEGLVLRTTLDESVAEKSFRLNVRR